MGKPAARLLDMHSCPLVTPGVPPIPHVGGPITGPGMPTVLIGGKPAAVVGDICTCVGPPDSIVMGSPTVFIGGKMAARMGDPTVHGGMVAIGCPTVLIGEGPVSSLRSFCPDIGKLAGMPLESRLQAERKIVSRLADVDPDVAASMDEMRHDRDLAVLSAAAYAGGAGTHPPGYAEASDADLLRLHVARTDLVPDMRVFRTTGPDGSDRFVLAFRGTETGAGVGTAARDIATDVLQSVGFQTEAYDRGTVVASAMKLSGEDVELTGHSKGGGQAAAASAGTGLRATTFNAAGVHPSTLAKVRGGPGGPQATQTAPTVRAYHNERDPLNAAQDNRVTVLGAIGAAAAYVGGLLGFAAVAQLAAEGALPQALGERRVVPPARNQGTGLGEGHSIDTMVQSMNERIEDALKDKCGC